MIILNDLTKAGTCESVTAMSETGLVVITVIYDEDVKLQIVNNISKRTDTAHMIGVIDAGIQYNFQAYNNRIKVTQETIQS